MKQKIEEIKLSIKSFEEDFQNKDGYKLIQRYSHPKYNYKRILEGMNDSEINEKFEDVVVEHLQKTFDRNGVSHDVLIKKLGHLGGLQILFQSTHKFIEISLSKMSQMFLTIKEEGTETLPKDLFSYYSNNLFYEDEGYYDYLKSIMQELKNKLTTEIDKNLIEEKFDFGLWLKKQDVSTELLDEIERLVSFKVFKNHSLQEMCLINYNQALNLIEYLIEYYVEVYQEKKRFVNDWYGVHNSLYEYIGVNYQASDVFELEEKNYDLTLLFDNLNLVPICVATHQSESMPYIYKKQSRLQHLTDKSIVWKSEFSDVPYGEITTNTIDRFVWKLPNGCFELNKRSNQLRLIGSQLELNHYHSESYFSKQLIQKKNRKGFLNLKAFR